MISVNTGRLMKVGQTVLVKTESGLFFKAKIVSLPETQHIRNIATIKWFSSLENEEVKMGQICDSTILAVKSLSEQGKRIQEQVDYYVNMGNINESQGIN